MDSDKTYSWTCPHCQRHTTITPIDYVSNNLFKGLENRISKIKNISQAEQLGVNFETKIIQCPNPDCKKHTTYIKESWAEYNSFIKTTINKKLNFELQIYPNKNFKVYLDCYKIPTVIISDYNEACLISELSPKASATLSRRCLQGILRDYWGVKPSSLFNEIKEIENIVDSITWEAIDSVRRLGNIGAHMEKVINQIIDVDEGEALLLIELIEILLDNWYVQSYEKQEKLKKIKSVADAKK